VLVPIFSTPADATFSIYKGELKMHLADQYLSTSKTSKIHEDKENITGSFYFSVIPAANCIFNACRITNGTGYANISWQNVTTVNGRNVLPVNSSECHSKVDSKINITPVGSYSTFTRNITLSLEPPSHFSSLTTCSGTMTMATTWVTEKWSRYYTNDTHPEYSIPHYIRNLSIYLKNGSNEYRPINENTIGFDKMGKMAEIHEYGFYNITLQTLG
jgi:hypothetical protein